LAVVLIYVFWLIGRDFLIAWKKLQDDYALMQLAESLDEAEEEVRVFNEFQERHGSDLRQFVNERGEIRYIRI
jgi:hypothetical protein